MRLIGKAKLLKLKNKNKGNTKLLKAIDQLILDIETNNWTNQDELKRTRKDADCVHSNGFYFFNLGVHRTLILIEFDHLGEASIVWCGTHKEYENKFKNNKHSIKNWLRAHDWI